MSLNSQQEADLLLQQWQSLRSMPPDERIELLFLDFFLPPPESDFLYELTMRCVQSAMEDINEYV
jgi:hypothetical protein